MFEYADVLAVLKLYWAVGAMLYLPFFIYIERRNAGYLTVITLFTLIILSVAPVFREWYALYELSYSGVFKKIERLLNTPFWSRK